MNLPAKVPERQKEVYRAAAASHGLGMADYVALVMARAHNLPVPEYIKPEEVSERFEQPLLAYEEEVRQTA